MSRLQPLRFIRRKSNSLFLRLVAGFLCIIVLLVSLTSYALSVSQNNIRNEIVKYNTLMLQNTKQNYEKHLEIIRQQMVLFYFSDTVQQLERDPRYSNFPAVIKDILYWVANPNLYIDNIVFYSKDHNFVLEKGTSTTPDTMFNAFMASNKYPKEFWDKQFEETYTSRMFPADSFYTTVFHHRQEGVGEFIPIVFKRSDNHDFYMVVFLDAQKMYTAFHQAINDDFVIYNGGGETIFKRPASGSYPSLDTLSQYGDSKFILDDNYYFYTKAAGSEMTYLHRLPVAELVSQTRLNFTMVGVIAAVILLSIVMSFILASRINHPFRMLIDSIRGTGDVEPFRSSIQEFDIIGSQLRDKNKLMKQWAFINHLKDIRNHENDGGKLDFSGKTFVFVLFHVSDKKITSWPEGTFQRWLYYIKVFIENKLNQTFPDALTFQIEHNEILSLVFIDQMGDLQDLLRDMKSVFDQDRDSGTITMAVTSIYDRAEQMNEAYKEVRDRIGERLLIDETQIVGASPGIPSAPVFTQEQDLQFRANLREGNGAALALLIEHFFAEWCSREVTAAAWFRFAEWVAERIRLTASDRIGPAKLDGILGNANARIYQCETTAELEHLLLDWVTLAADAVREKTEPKDSITSFVIDYVNENLAEEIYLDALSEKLNLSSGYLSSYFKEKTGTNIVEYVNETRIRKAAALLVDTRLKIQEVAEAVGYRNIASFNRMFKKYTGLRPSEYRKGGNTLPD